MRCARPPRRPRAWLASITLFAVAASGCKTATRAQQEAEIQKAIREYEEQRARARQEAEAEALREKDRQILALEERANKMAEAQFALASNQPGRALEIVGEILDPPPETEERVINEATGEKETITIVPPEIPDKERAQLLGIKALAHYDLKDIEQAVATYREVVALDPSLRIPRQNLGRLLYEQQRYAEALEVWQLELEDGYWDVEILELIGQAHFELYRADHDPSRLDAARLCVQLAAMKDPANVKYRRHLAYFEYESKRYHEAIRLLEAIRRQYPTDREYLEVLADAYTRTQDYDKALDVLELSVRLSSGPPPKKLCDSLGDLYRVKGMYGTAADWLTRGFRGDPQRAPAKDRLAIGRLLSEAARLEEALRWLGTIEAPDAEYFEAQSVLASIHQDLGQQDEALEAYENIRHVRPTDGLAHLAAGDIYLDRKELGKAHEAYTKASGSAQTKADGLAGLGEVAYEKGHLELAAQYYRKAVSASPNDRRFLVALREIEDEIAFRRERGELTPEDAAETDHDDIAEVAGKAR